MQRHTFEILLKTDKLLSLKIQYIEYWNGINSFLSNLRFNSNFDDTFKYRISDEDKEGMCTLVIETKRPKYFDYILMHFEGY